MIDGSRNGLKPAGGKVKQTFFTVVEPAELMNYLLDQMPDKSRKTIKSLLAHHQVSVDYRVTTQFNHRLKPGQQVVINWSKVLQESPHRGMKILYEDPYLIVIEKPPGLLSIATEKENERTAFRILSDQLKKTNPKGRIFVVHRLDREASGIMMFAKDKETQQLLQHAWDEDVIERSYVVVVEGLIPQEHGTITSWLKENKALVVYSSPTPGDGKKAITHYRVIKKNIICSLLEVKLQTGRKNQIRIHMKDLGHSIIGDKKYGGRENPMKRLGLHARVLAFRHPMTGKELRFETPIPKVFLRLFTGGMADKNHTERD
ncbi:MAG: RluA family pseudouridine synthase [Desulfomonilia bacterium]